MALTITQTPPVLNLAQSPIPITLSESTNVITSSSFQYVLDLYYWDGAPNASGSAKYTLVKLTGSQATLQLDGIITANKMEDVNADLNLSGLQKGEIIVDVKTGWLIESKVEQELKMDIEQDGVKFPATISGLITTTSKKK